MGRVWHAIWNRRDVALAFLVLGIGFLGLAGWVAISPNSNRSDQREARAVRVATADGKQTLGWWTVRYSNQLRKGDTGIIEVTYNGDWKAWQKLSARPTHSVVTVRPPDGIDVSPANQLSKEFDKTLILQTQSPNDIVWPSIYLNYIWTFSIRSDVSYPISSFIVLEFSIAPPILKPLPVKINDTDVTNLGPNDYPLSVNVVSRHIIDPELMDLFTYAFSGLAFLLALPWMKLVVERLLPARSPSRTRRR